MDNNQKALSHYGVIGMRWGKSGVRKATSGMVKGWTKSADRAQAKSEKLREKARMKNDPIKKRRLEAKAENKQKQSESIRNMVSGLKKAEKLVEGMNMRQAADTIQNKAGYSKGLQIYTKIMASNDNRLTYAMIDYAAQVTKGGQKSV